MVESESDEEGAVATDTGAEADGDQAMRDAPSDEGEEAEERIQSRRSRVNRRIEDDEDEDEEENNTGAAAAGDDDNDDLFDDKPAGGVDDAASGDEDTEMKGNDNANEADDAD